MSDIKTRIFLPKGEALEACTRVCENELGAELPLFNGIKLSEETNEFNVYWLKPKDIPPLIADGKGDIAAVGEDVLLESRTVNIEWGPGVSDRSAGTVFARAPKQSVEPMCRFSILGLKGKGEEQLREILEGKGEESTGEAILPSANPNMLDNYASFMDLPVSAYRGFIPSGSVETYAKLLGAPGVADLVQTGCTAGENDLVEIEKLLDIYPRIVTRIEK